MTHILKTNNMPQTIEQVQDILTAKGIRFLTEAPQYEWEDVKLGILLGRGSSWTWFKVSDKFGLVFEHTYSQNTGKSHKSYAHRSAKYKALDKLGIQNLYTGL